MRWGLLVGVRQKLITLLLTIGLAPVVITGIIAFFSNKNELQDTTINQLQSTAIRQEQRINTLIQMRREEVIRFANQFDLQVAIAQYLENPDAAKKQELFTIIENEFLDVIGIQNIYLADLSSTVITSTVNSSGGSTLSGEEFTVPETEQTNISIRQDPLDNVNKLYITTRLSVNNQDVAYLVMTFLVNDIVAAVQDYTGLGSTGETVIASVSDSETLSLFPLRFDADAALSTRLDSLSKFDITVPFTGTDYRDQEVIVVERPIRFTDWVMAVKIDTLEAFSSINRFRDTLLVIIFISSFVIIAVSYIISGIVARRIGRMTVVAKQIGAGNLSARTNFSRRDEIGVLGRSIDNMGYSLGRFVHNLESERNRLSIIINNIYEGILAIDKNGHIILANKAITELTHLKPEEMVGRPIKEVFTWLRGQTLVDVDYTASEDQTYPDLEFKDSNGNTHYIKLVITRVRISEQAYIQTIVTVNDETKRRELENMKLDFVSMAAHELRTPLSSLRGYLELMRYKTRKGINPEEIGHFIEQSLRSSAELSGLISNLLDVSRIESGTMMLSFEKTDLAQDIVLPSIKDITFSANEKRINIASQGLTQDCFIDADKIAIREVIDNLLSNAIHYTDPGGSITVNIKKDGTNFVVEVTDTGIGIAEKAIPNLFAKFYRVHGGLASGSVGTGLGLFISKSILERHKGSIAVTSKEGVGSTFSFSVPEYQGDTQSSSKHEVRGHRGWTTKNITR